jgi:hypothetical protein
LTDPSWQLAFAAHATAEFRSQDEAMTDATAQSDVFLSHNSADKPAVKALAKRLLDVGLQPWLDTWNLIPGEPWEEAIEQALDTCATCAVFLGPSGTGPWHNEEMWAALDRRARDRTRGFRVIPVLLPGADPVDPATLPRFLGRMTWVDFRSGLDDAEAFRRLLAGIRGVAPGPSASARSTVAAPSAVNASALKTLTPSERERLKAELVRLQTQHDTWTRRIAALDTDIGRALDSLQKQILEERRGDLVAEREMVIGQMQEIETRFRSAEVMPTPPIDPNPGVRSAEASEPNNLGESLRLAFDRNGNSLPAKSSASGPKKRKRWTKRQGVLQWDKSLFETDVEKKSKAMQKLREIANSLIVGAMTPEQHLSQFKELLYGYTAYVNREKESWSELIKGIVAHLRRFQGNQVTRQEEATRDLLDDFTIWLLELVRGDETGKLYDDLKEVCIAAWESLKHMDPSSEKVWFSRLFKAVRAICDRDCVDTLMLKKLRDFLYDTFRGIEDDEPLWANEFYAFYLEQFADLWEKQDPAQSDVCFRGAADTSVKAARLAASDSNVNDGDREFANAFAAAMHARAAYCYERIRDKESAAEHLHIAVDKMLPESRASRLKDQYCRTANRLRPSLVDGGQLAKKFDRQELDYSGPTSRGNVAIISNEYDEVFADWLLDSLTKEGFSPELHPAKTVPPLHQLLQGDIVGAIIVGGIRAPLTDRLLRTDRNLYKFRTDQLMRKKIHGVEPPDHKISFRELERRTQDYCAIWVTCLNQRPVAVLAGSNRMFTCKAAVTFVRPGNKDFTDFVDRILPSA